MLYAVSFYICDMKRIYCLLPLAYCLLLFSCGEPEKQITTIPSSVLPKEKMAAVITDIHLAEAEANLNTLPDSASTAQVGFQKIFEKNSISKAQYDSSLVFYVDHPELINEVYEIVMNELSKRQGEVAK